MELREYQQESINKIKELKIGDKGIISLPTGTGKTIVMSGLVKEEATERILIVVMSTELREQTIDKLKFVCGENVDVGSIQGKLNECDNNIIVATRQSLTHVRSSRLKDITVSGDFKYIIFDECHVAVEQIKKIIDAIGQNSIVIGVTATPYNPKMVEIFDNIIYEMTLLKAIKSGYLVEPKAKKVYSNTDISNVKTIGGEFIQKHLEEAINNDDRNNIIVKSYLDYAQDRKHTIIFASGINHANAITQCFQDNGIDARSIDSTIDSTERKNTLEDFKKGKFKILVNVSILTTGFDFPALDCVIMARSTKSRILYMQCLGRVLRLSEGKENALIIDIGDITKKFSLVNIDSIFNITFKDDETLSEAEERIRKADEDEKELLRLEQEEREKQKIEQLRLEAEEIDLFNSNISNIYEYSSLDWFEWYYNKNIYYILSLNDKLDIVLTKVDDEFITYKYEDKQLIEHERNENLKEIVDNIDNMAYTYGSSFIDKNAKWKKDKPTEKQIACIKGNWKVYTKFDCHKYFKSKSLYFAFKNLAN
jgi:superfamily II DNA or RNA helicase